MIYPANYPLTIEQRARFERFFTIKDTDGVPYDLTGFSCVASLWTESRRKLADFTFAWVNQAGGSFTLSLTSAQTSALAGAAIWDMLVTDPDGAKDYWLRGPVLIEQGFTV